MGADARTKRARRQGKSGTQQRYRDAEGTEGRVGRFGMGRYVYVRMYVCRCLFVFVCMYVHALGGEMEMGDVSNAGKNVRLLAACDA